MATAQRFPFMYPNDIVFVYSIFRSANMEPEKKVCWCMSLHTGGKVIGYSGVALGILGLLICIVNLQFPFIAIGIANLIGRLI